LAATTPAPAAQARNTNTAAERIYKMKDRKPARNSNFIQRAEALQKKIKARTGTDFDISALIEESRRRPKK